VAIKEAILKLKTGKCPHCKAKQMKIRLEKPTTFYEGEKRIIAYRESGQGLKR
jgi:DNA-directed RNA polymerase beta' subunit